MTNYDSRTTRLILVWPLGDFAFIVEVPYRESYKNTKMPEMPPIYKESKCEIYDNSLKVI